MAFSLTNKVINVSPQFIGVGESTNFQLSGTGTTTSTSVANPYFEFADYTSTFTSIPGSSQGTTVPGGIGDFQVARMGYRALVSFKAYVPGTTTSTGPIASYGIGPLVTLEAATSTAFAPVYTLDFRYLPSAGSTASGATSTGSANVGGPNLFMFGVVPITSGCQFARIGLYACGAATAMASSTGIDAIIQAV